MMKKSKTIAQIYDEVKDFDLVLTVDPSLVTALNKSIRTSRIGKLAYTPFELARKYSSRIFNSELMSKADLVLHISRTLNQEIKKLLN